MDDAELRVLSKLVDGFVAASVRAGANRTNLLAVMHDWLYRDGLDPRFLPPPEAAGAGHLSRDASLADNVPGDFWELAWERIMAAKKRGALVEGGIAATATGKAGEANAIAGKQLTVRIAREMDFRLESIAHSEGLPKSAMVIKLLDQGLQRYGFDAELRNIWATICRKAGEAA